MIIQLPDYIYKENTSSSTTPITLVNILVVTIFYYSCGSRGGNPILIVGSEVRHRYFQPIANKARHPKKPKKI